MSSTSRVNEDLMERNRTRHKANFVKIEEQQCNNHQYITLHGKRQITQKLYQFQVPLSREAKSENTTV